ncbi:MAG: SUMF1/EgtB/PvdO family nonheme iron enzyme [Verrucomicrobiales bacterium]
MNRLATIAAAFALPAAIGGAQDAEAASKPHADLAAGVASDNIKLVEAIRALVLETSTEKSEAEMKEYNGKIPSTGATFAMVPIPSGRFLMGSPPDEPNRREDEGPQREVEVAPFWMGKFEVTWDLYLGFCEGFDRRYAITGKPTLHLPDAALADFVSGPTELHPTSIGTGQRAASGISHHAASKFCQWLSATTGHYYRLPTEAEWEYACRAGTATPYSFGGDPKRLSAFAVFWDIETVAGSRNVGCKKPNPWGLFDMHGNVSEWCLDQYFAGRYKADRDSIPARALYPRAYRGGSWDDDPEDLRSARRFASRAELNRSDPRSPKSIWINADGSHIGFRLVRPLQTPSAKTMDALWNSGAVSESKAVNAKVRDFRDEPSRRAEAQEP